MKIKHKYTGQVTGGTYKHWKENILKNHVEVNYDILTKPDLVDVYKINSLSGRKVFIETIDRRIAIDTYLAKSDQYTIQNTDLTNFDELYRPIKIKTPIETLIDTLKKINSNGTAVVTQDTSEEKNEEIHHLKSQGYLEQINPYEYRLSNEGLKFMNTQNSSTIESLNAIEKIKVSQNQQTNKIFIVHGHNNEIKLNVARTLEKLGLEPVILHEQANGGKTIIEKFEKYSDVGFAIALLTNDDSGKAKADKKFSERARQNVILELGYFIGRLGRNKVCPLYVKGVELPSDLYGLAYTEINESDSWKYKLVTELKEAGYDVDANKIC